MNRRDLLAATGAGAVLGTSGCLGSDQNSTPAGNETENNTDDEQPDEKEFPDLPDELTQESARQYVAEYEAVHHYNIRKFSSNSVGVNCNVVQAVVNLETEDGMYVSISECPISTSTRNSDEVVAGDEMSNDTLYFLSENRTIRIDPEKGQIDDMYYGDDQVPSDAKDVWLSNFAEQDHDLSLQLVHQIDDPVVVVERTIDLASESGFRLNNIAGIPGEYKLHVSISDEQSATELIEISDENSSMDILRAVIITPDNELRLTDLEFEEYS